MGLEAFAKVENLYKIELCRTVRDRLAIEATACLGRIAASAHGPSASVSLGVCGVAAKSRSYGLRATIRSFVLSAVIAGVFVLTDVGTSQSGQFDPPSGARSSSVAATVGTEKAAVLVATEQTDSRAGLAAGQRSALSVAGGAPNLTSGERLNLRVRGYPELSGEYRLNPDHTISLAGLGRVAINALSASEFEDHLGERLSVAMRREISVSVEIARFKPFFITGQVAQPGAIEWQPGLTLIQALSLAGGIARSPTRSEIDTPERGLLIDQARTQLRFALAQLARLKAEKEGKDTVESTRVLDKLLESAPPESRQAMAAFLVRQNELLAEQRELIRSRITRLESEQEMASGELDAARAQEKEIRKQLDISTELTASVERLKDERLIASARYLSQQRDLIDSKVRFSESRALVERARGRVGSLGREIEAIRQERRTVLNDRIEGLEREVAQLDLTLRDAGMNVSSAPEPPPSLTYNIARKSNTGVQTISADLFTEIHSSDVVIISSQPRVMPGLAAVPDIGGSRSRTTLERTQQIMESSAAPRSLIGQLLAGRPSTDRH